ncbi:methylated-DNA--[protein]-cysteine S-methyltransferase [Mailhella sp.]|uniref:methylated-DNA--[protein]-cysteine S-methyltransferase n=1 Tax=Mailhella sp. TaxID=1981029 RepID=UPI004062E48E
MPAMLCESPIGRLLLEEEAGGLSRIRLLAPAEEAPLQTGSTPLLKETRRQLDAYFAGRLRSFDLPVSAQGTPFQLAVWDALRRIGYGAVKTYGDIAREAGAPRGFRAVGMACHRNPVLIVVPCHRVVGAGGKLTGFACGLEVKRFLLEHEGALLGKGV